MLVPWRGCCWTLLTMVGSGSPATSSTVGATSMTWWNWLRVSPLTWIFAGQWTMGAVTGAAPVGGDLLGPLIRGVHGMGPADRVMVEGFGRAELVDPGRHELGRLQRGGTIHADHLVEGALQGPLGRGPVVPDDVVDQGVVQDLQLGQGVDQPADVVVGVLQEPGVDLHLAGQHRLERLGHVVPGRDLVVAAGKLGVGRDHAQCLLPLDRLLALPVPALVELALVP